MTPQPNAIVQFWLEAGPGEWFKGRAAFDEEIRRRFGAAHSAVSHDLLVAWSEAPEATLAFVLLTDQFPRHLYRGTARAFSTDPLAREAAAHAVASGFDQAIQAELRPFFYLPFEHHEDVASQTRSVELFTRLATATGDASYLKYAELHAELIRRFGRFPHRNAALGRPSTPEELAYLASGGFKG